MLGVVDWVLTTVSLIVVFGVAIGTSVVRRRGREDATTAFFLAGREMKWWVTAASLFASNIGHSNSHTMRSDELTGTEHFVGQAGLAATSGIAVSVYGPDSHMPSIPILFVEWGAVYLLVLLGWVFAPVYLKLKLRTIPEYLELRFDQRCRLWFVMLTMATYVVAKIGSSLFSGAVMLDVLADLNLWTSTSIILIATAIYTTIGGLTVSFV